MLLDRIDIDTHGPLTQVALGPFSQTLNAVIAASGSGKTALVRFLRDSLTGTTPAREGLADSRGRVVWAAADGLYHCRREPNGTAEGRRFVEFEARLADAYGRSRHGREAIVVDLPACVVDGIVTDTVMLSVQRCVQAAIASGLDHTSVTFDSSRDIEINDLRREIAELEKQIHSQTLHAQHATARVAGAYDSFGLTLDMKRLRDRRAELTLEISAIDARRDWAEKAEAEMERRRRKRELFASLADEIQRLRRQESELKMRLAEVDAALEKMNEEASRAENREAIAKAYRTRLEQVESQLGRVRGVIREVRALGDHWFGGRGLASQSRWLDQAIDGATRAAEDFALDQDRVAPRSLDDNIELSIHDRGWSASLASSIRVDDSVAASAVDVQRRIDTICRMVDNLVGRCEEHQAERVHPQLDDQVTDWDTWAESEMSRHERRRNPGANAFDSRRSRDAWTADSRPSIDRGRSDLDRTSSSDALESSDRFEPTRSLDRAERLLQEERSYRATSLTNAGENVAWLAGVLNGVSQRLRGLAGNRAAYGATNLDPLFHPRRDENSITDPSNIGSSLDPEAQIAAVRRCERELIDALRQLTTRREVMLRRIAEAQDLPMSRATSSVADDAVSHDDPQLYQWLVRDRIAACENEIKHREAAKKRLQQQQADLANDLKRTQTRTLDRVAEAETIRMYLRSLPVVHRYDDDAQLRARLVAEIKAIDSQLSKPRVHPSVLERHAQCVTRLRSLTSSHQAMAGLAADASEHLRRLSGGRLNNVSWHRAQSGLTSGIVEIDGRSEITCNAVERFLAAVAVRLAAADELARRGRSLPVIIETPAIASLGGQGLVADLRSLLQSGVDALAENARRGRQIIVLTDDAVVADAIMRVGGSVQSIAGARSHVGEQRTIHHQVASHHHAVSPRSREARSGERLFDVNRDFDLAWREAIDEQPVIRREEITYSEKPLENLHAAVSMAAPMTRSRFDAPASASHSTSRTWTQSSAPHAVAETSKEASYDRVEAVEIPFFLTGLSPVEQAPSIDAAAAQRLREIGITRIEQLLSGSPKQIADSMRHEGVDASVIRRWQHECRLMCGVKKLRGFDARVLAGCGITHPKELAEIEPGLLVERVEAFLATERGERIRRSGTSQEIARLTDWLQHARRRSTSQRPADSTNDQSRAFANVGSAERVDSLRSLSNPSTTGRSASTSSNGAAPTNATGRSGSRFGEARRSQSASRFAAAEPDTQRANRTDGMNHGDRATRESSAKASETGEETLRFYLSRSSDVEAAPSIGPKMAERLHRIGVVTVDDLLNRSAAEIADALKHSKVDKEVVRQWQQQATLVCRVPMLRGHDAQLLVAAGIASPERLSTCDPTWLLSQIDPIANSREGKSILRGGKHPDLAEMREWIGNAQKHRELVAA